MQRGASSRRAMALSLFVALGLIGAAAPAPASAATQIGETVPPTPCDGGFTYFQTGAPPASRQYAAPSAGVITSWSFQADPSAATTLKLKVGRRVGTSQQFLIVGESPVKTADAGSFNTYTDVRIPVLAGDAIGVFLAANEPCARAIGGYSYAYTSGDAPPGTTPTFFEIEGFQFDVSAILESDCDSDGFGDETQDPNLAPCPPAPETTITKGPKDRTKKKHATFEFTANEPGASFECSLDGRAFAPCTSPHAVKVRKGKHTFAVRATDAGNNVEGSPASDDWKVKKKKKKSS
ncbi:MAG TPA: hypothetical protein VEK39_13065 [Solirubrobacterales bacterium]|nr:hypothetical protein [Solirubrobacterales bacterium]